MTGRESGELNKIYILPLCPTDESVGHDSLTRKSILLLIFIPQLGIVNLKVVIAYPFG